MPKIAIKLEFSMNVNSLTHYYTLSYSVSKSERTVLLTEVTKIFVKNEWNPLCKSEKFQILACLLHGWSLITATS